LKHLGIRRNAALVLTYAVNSVCAKFAEMARHVDDAIQADGLQAAVGAGQGFILDHARSETEVVVHIFGIRPEHAREVHAGSDHYLAGVADKGGDLAFADA
jgi:hypothetical protein